MFLCYNVISTPVLGLLFYYCTLKRLEVNIMVNFGVKLKELRLQSGMTQKQLAQKLRVTTSVISYYERQERYPSPDVLIRLSYIFHTSTDYLLGIEDKKVKGEVSFRKNEIEVLNQILDKLKSMI